LTGEPEQRLKRTLKNRHLQMIAIGGAVGTGLFYGSAHVLQYAGPAIILAYAMVGVVIYLIVRALGEMAVQEPVAGSFSYYAYRYWDGFAGFFSGWNYWFCCVAVSMAELAVIGIYIQFGLETGPYTILLGCLGIFPGFFYSTRPIRLVDRGVGEILIGFCYGWLPVASAFYIQTGYIAPVIHWIGIPIGFTIFNVILLNEFPDYIADKEVGKKNLLVRLGTERGAWIYSAAAILTWVFMLFSLNLGVSLKALYLFLPVMALSAAIILKVMNREYENQKTLEVLCGLNIAINVGTTSSYIVAYV